MKRLIAMSGAALMLASVLPADPADARDGVRRTRITVYARPSHPSERGTVYGYAPGNYLVGPTGLLYGPYPPYWHD
jgi:hypothetical protein